MTSSPEYVDHPAPSVFFVLFLVGLPVVLIAASASTFGRNPLLWVLIAIVWFYLWPMYSTYYTIGPDGIGIRYGPWKRSYTWSEFSEAYWQKGMFAMRIGWPSVTPCVRVTNGILLKCPGKMFGLYLTPNDSKAFLARISEFAPDLTRRTIV